MMIAWRPAKAEEPSKRGKISWNVVNVGMIDSSRLEEGGVHKENVETAHWYFWVGSVVGGS